MGKFTEEMQESTFSPTIIQPVEDRSTAAAIEAVGYGVSELMKGSKRVAGKEAAEEYEREVVGGLQMEKYPSVDTSEAGIAKTDADKAARKLAPLGRSSSLEVRAESKLKELLAKHSLFQDEVKQAFVSRLGFDPTGRLIKNSLAEIKSLENAAASKDDWEERKAVQLNIVPDDVQNPGWRNKLYTTMNELHKEASVERKKGASARELKSTILKKYTPGRVVGSVVGELNRQLPDLNLKPGASVLELKEWAMQLDKNQVNSVVNVLTSTMSSLISESQSNYSSIGDSKEFQTAQEVIKGRVESLVDFVTNPDEAKASRIKAEVEAYEISAWAEFSNKHPGLANMLILTKDHPDLVSFATNKELGKQFEDAITENWKISDPGLSGPLEQTKDEVSFIEKLMDIGLENNPQIKNYTAALAAKSKLVSAYYDNYDDLDLSERQKVVQKIDILLSVLAKPKFAEFINHPNFDTEQRQAIQRNLAVTLDKHLPRMYQKVVDDLTKSGGEVSVSQTTGLLLVDKNAPSGTRRTVDRINTAVKAVTNSTGGGSVEKYKGILEGIVSKITELTQQERGASQAPVKGKAEKLVSEMKKLSELKASSKTSSSKRGEIKAIEERIQNLQKEIKEMTGELSFQENEDQVNALRVAGLRKKHGSDLEALSDEEILKGLA